MNTNIGAAPKVMRMMKNKNENDALALILV
jgi:hypothetical protein